MKILKVHKLEDLQRTHTGTIIIENLEIKKQRNYWDFHLKTLPIYIHTLWTVIQGWDFNHHFNESIVETENFNNQMAPHKTQNSIALAIKNPLRLLKQQIQRLLFGSQETGKEKEKEKGKTLERNTSNLILRTSILYRLPKATQQHSQTMNEET